MHTDWFKIVFLQLNRNTGLAQAADVNNGTSKENLHFDDQSKQVVFLFLWWNFLTEIENMSSMFPSSYR